jgi:hypothetical protein
MRKLILILSGVAAAIAAAAIFLIATTPKAAEPIRFPLSPSHRRLLAYVPPSAESFALIPSAALLHGRLLANPVTREAVLQWREEQELPRPWMLGAADLVAWKDGKTTSYAVRLDSLRAVIVRAWLMMASTADARWEGSTLIMHDPVPHPAGAANLDGVLRLVSGLPPGDVLMVQRESARGAFPPIGRPAVTSLRLTPAEILLVSRAANAGPGPSGEIRARFPRGAMLAAAFAAPPRVLGDLNRLLGARIDALVDEGGAIALYDVETGGLLPRPRGVIVMPAGEHARAQLEDAEDIIRLVGETRDTGSQLLLSFDRTSMGLYIKDAFVPATWPANRWALRRDPQRRVPVLRRTGDSAGLRFAAPRIHRAARDLRRWIDALEQAEAVEAADSVTDGVEALRVRVTSK